MIGKVVLGIVALLMLCSAAAEPMARLGELFGIRIETTTTKLEGIAYRMDQLEDRMNNLVRGLHELREDIRERHRPKESE